MINAFAICSIAIVPPTPVSFNMVKVKNVLYTANVESFSYDSHQSFNFDHNHMLEILNSKSIKMPSSIHNEKDFDAWFDSIIPTL